MKILAIRGKNLASLAGEFDIDLQHGALARAGLFAITGRTGAGKSTLLDAMCLALFGRTPRLSGRSRVKLGGDGPDADLRDGDPRVLLRRGTGEGWAEVDFEGHSGKAWRARWTVRRARVDPSQRLQAAQMSLCLLADGRSYGDTKTDVLDRIESELGLTFDQFTRSVLLAQGEFAAFLQASGKDRASLLEKMTGTALYAELSSRCHERRREEELKLDGLRQSSRDLQLLTSLERAALTDAAAASDRLRRELQTDLEAYQVLAAWHDLVEADRSALALANQAAAASEAAWTTRAPRLLAVDALLAVAPFEAQLEAARLAHSKAQITRESLRQAEASATTDREAAADAQRAAIAALTAATATQTETQPRIDAARVLDGRIADHAAAHDAQATGLAAAQARLEEGATEITRLETEVEADVARLALLRDWVEQHPTAARLASEQTRWTGALRALERAGAAHASTSDEVSAADRELTSLHAALATLEAERSRVELARTRTQSQLEALRALGGDEASVLERDQKLREARQHRDDATRLSAEITALQDRLAETDAERQRSSAKQDTDTARRQTLETALPIALAQREEAMRAYERARATESLASQRFLLVDGEPCPLCGSTSHPAKDEPFAALLHDAHARFTELDQAVQKSTLEHSALEASLPSLQASIDANQRQAAILRSQLERARATLQEHLASLGEPLSAALDHRLDREKIELHELARRWREAVSERHTAQEARLDIDERVRVHRERVTAAETRRAAAAAALTRATADFEGAVRDLDDLFAPEPGWSAIQPSTASAFLEPWLRLRDTAARHGAELARTEDHLTERTAHAASLRASLQHQRAEVDKLRSAHERGALALEKLRLQRASILSHADVDAVATRLKDAVSRADAALHGRRGELERATAELSALGEQRSAAQARLDAAHQALIEASAQADRAAAEAGLDPLTYRRDLAVGIDALKAEHQELTAERSTLLATRARRDTLHEHLQALESNAPAAPAGPVPDDARACRVAVEGVAANLETATQNWGHNRGRLEADDQARQQHQQVEVRLHAQAAITHRWTALNELIGSADGSKLRKFAQSLTLDSLLAHANAHLSELAPRYHLQRVPGEDLEIQVLDTDMGDDIRPITSLSGGESFLVSLALALGLSSLAARDVRIDSLFIDEGFGTLDQQTLQLVLDTLDTLQATGRKVGIISHVAGIAERVGYRIDIRARGQGRSIVRVHDAI